MSANMFSPSWYLVKDMIIRLRSHVRVERHTYRQQVWYVIQDSISGQHHRVSSQSYEIVGRLNGESRLDEVWLSACDTLDEDMPTQDDVIALLSKLFRASLLHADRVPDIFELSERTRETKRRKVIQQLKSPLGIKVPLLDPDGFLNRTHNFVSPILSYWGALLWLIVVTLGVLLATMHWTALTTNISDRMLSMGNVFLLMCIYPVVKAVHELGHAYVVKKWGGEVHEMGLMFLVFFPVPYVDASAASVFANKYQRMLVGLAGVLVELFIAALAMVVWALAEPGLVRALAYNTMMVAGVSTVFFNGNPLLKFDAYYVLADYLEMPNLATRANHHIGYLSKKYLLSMAEAEPVAYSHREALILFLYAVSAFCYRMVIMMVIALFIASKYFLVGVLLAMWSVYSGLFSPMFKVLIKPFNDPGLRNKKALSLAWFALVVGGVFTLLFVIPLPRATHVHGVFWVGEDDHVRAQNDGFIKAIHVNSETLVKAETALIEMSSPVLENRLEQLTAATEEARARVQSSVLDRNRLAISQELLDYSQQEQARMQERIDALSILSQREGVFILPEAENLLDRYVKRGESLGYLVNFASLPVTVMIAEDYIHTVKEETLAVEIRLVSETDKVYQGKIARFFPASTRSIPSEILTVEAGGEIVVNPQAGESLQSIAPYFQILVDIQGAPAKRLNERAYVRFLHPDEPLGFRIIRSARRVFLRQLDV